MKSDPDEAVIQELKRAGSDVDKPTSVRFYVYMPDEAKAQLVAQRAAQDGDDIKVRLGADHTSWLCLITRTMTPEAAALRAIRRNLTGLATELGGEYDGWEAAVVR